MNEDQKPPPGRSTTDRRRDREAEALRANLRRRKEQQRARETAVQPAEPAGIDTQPNGDEYDA